MDTALEKTTTRILVVDDHTILRQGLVRLLAGEDDLEVCGEAGNGREAVDKAKELAPDLVIMDLAMPGLNGLDSTRRILRVRPGARVLVLSMYIDEEYVTQAVEAGVNGYVLKDAPPDEILEAVRAVASGQRFFTSQIPPEVLERAHSDKRRRQRKASELTHREREVMKLLAEGNTVKAIAGILGLSQKTVDTHKTNLMKKLNIHNRVDLVKYAINEKLIQL